MSYIPENTVQYIGHTIMCFRPVVILQEIKILRKTTVAFLKTITSISKVLFQIFFLLIFCSILCLHIFYGLLESRCRLSPFPINGSWPINPLITNLCGYDDCPEK